MKFLSLIVALLTTPALADPPSLTAAYTAEFFHRNINEYIIQIQVREESPLTINSVNINNKKKCLAAPNFPSVAQAGATVRISSICRPMRVELDTDQGAKSFIWNPPDPDSTAPHFDISTWPAPYNTRVLLIQYQDDEPLVVHGVKINHGNADCAPFEFPDTAKLMHKGRIDFADEIYLGIKCSPFSVEIDTGKGVKKYEVNKE
jgi:hypothetical protein